MDIDVPLVLRGRATDWDELHRWERAELGRALRRLGLTYGEIRGLIPVPKGTLSGWCREVRLTEEQIAAIRRRTGPASRTGIPVDTQWKRRLEIAQIREEATAEVPGLLAEPLWVAGVALYWGEGSKTKNTVDLANSEPAILRTHIAWIRRYVRTQLSSCSRCTCTKATTNERPWRSGEMQPDSTTLDSPRRSSSPRAPAIARTIFPTECVACACSRQAIRGSGSCSGSTLHLES